MALSGIFSNHDSGPIKGASAVSPGTNCPDGTRGIWVGGAGNVNIQFHDDSFATFQGVAAGTLIPIHAKQVVSSGTTATLMLALI